MIAIPERGIYLASRSPRRRELLAQIGVRFHLLLFRSASASTPKWTRPLAGEAPAAYVERMARAKAEAAGGACCRETCRLRRSSPPIPPWRWTDGSSASPKTVPRRRRCSPRLSGQRHEVLTAVALKNYEQAEFALSSSKCS